MPHAHNSPATGSAECHGIQSALQFIGELTHAANASCRLSGQAWRNGVESLGPTYGPDGFAPDRTRRAQRAAAGQTLERHSVREGIHQSAAASEANLRARRFWSGCGIVARTGGMELRRLRRA